MWTGVLGAIEFSDQEIRLDHLLPAGMDTHHLFVKCEDNQLSPSHSCCAAWGGKPVSTSTSTSPCPRSPVYSEADSVHSQIQISTLTGPNLAKFRGSGLRRKLFSTRFNISELAPTSARLNGQSSQRLKLGTWSLGPEEGTPDHRLSSVLGKRCGRNNQGWATSRGSGYGGRG